MIAIEMGLLMAAWFLLGLAWGYITWGGKKND